MSGASSRRGPTLRGRGPTLGRAFVALFSISTAFPVVAGFLPESPPPILGGIDVATAFVVVVLGFALDGRWRPDVTDRERSIAWQAIRIGAVAILVLLGLFFVAPTIAHWDVLLIGLGWRAWLLITILPSLVVALQPDAGPPPL